MTKSTKPIVNLAKKEDFEKTLKGAIEWLDSLIQESPHGVYWSKVEKEEPNLAEMALYSGSAGIIIYYLEYAKLFQDENRLETAKQAGDYLIYFANNYDFSQESIEGNWFLLPKNHWTEYNGFGGIIFTLIELYKATEIKKYQEAANRLLDHLVEDAEEVDEGLVWTGETGNLADGGIVSLLLYASEELERPDLLDIADQAGQRILSTAEIIDDTSIKFHPVHQSYTSKMWDLDEDIIYEWPNYEYGTAGVGTVLGRLFQETGKEEYKLAAIQAGQYIKDIATEVGEGADLTPYRLPDMTNLFYLGNCHGPVGNSRLYDVLYQITGEEKYLDQIKRYGRGILATGAPELHSGGYWHVYQQCCGTSGFIELFTLIHHYDSNTEFLDAAERASNKILSEAEESKEGIYWSQSWSRIDPTEYDSVPGYFEGSAGIASALLHYYSLVYRDYYKIKIFDDAKSK